MKIFMRKFFILLSLYTMTTTTATAVEISTIGQAVDVAGRQRMLSYAELKYWLMVSMDSSYKHPKESLEQSVKLFEESNQALSAFKNDKILHEKLAEGDRLFKAFKQTLSQPFEAKRGWEYFEKADTLKKTAHQAVLRLQELSGAKSAEVLNKMGRLRAVSQKITVLYLLKTLGIASPALDTAMKKAMTTFRGSLDFLNAAGLSEEIQARLKKLEKIYRFFDIMNGAEKFVPTIIGKKATRTVKYANEMIQLYLKQKK